MSNIILTPSGEFVTKSTILYGQVVNKERQLPLVYDGLKPVYRRAIYSALKFKGEHVKTATLVGDMISTTHPSGDKSCVPVISNLVHYGILDGRGNHGIKKLDGQEKQPAAMRYTEAWISKKYDDIFRPLLDYVPWRETDLASTEPCHLPSPIPLCMTFGLLGIGHGVLSRIPCFTASSIYRAVMADDPNLLEAPFGLELDKSRSELEELWRTGVGRVTYQYKVYSGKSADGTQGVYIEGIPEFFLPDIGAFDDWKAANKIFINDETDKNHSRIFIGKFPGIRVISVDDILEMAKDASVYSKTYRLNVAFDDYVCIIPLKEWLTLTLNNYLKLVEEYKTANLERLYKEEKVYVHAKDVAETFLKDTEQTNDQIAAKLGIEEEIVQAILRRSIGSLRKTDFEPKLNAVRSQIENFKSLKAEEFTKEVVSKL